MEIRNPTSDKSTGSDHIWKSLPWFLLLNLSIAFGLMIIFCPTCFFSWSGLQRLIPQFFISFMMSSALSYGGYLVDYYFDVRLSWIKYPVKRLVLTILVYGCYSFLVSIILVLFYSTITGQISIDNVPWRGIISNTQMPMGIAFIIMAVFTARSWLMEWRNAAIEAEQLKSEKLASQNQSLRDQLNPHFLFNSLNALSNLVYENPDKSAVFIQQLSRIYRYVLDVQQEELVSLNRELDFAENYLSLQKIRFEESLSYEIEIGHPDGFFLPPLSLQLLMENAIKHNIASMENPLRISIKQQGDVLMICNNLQPKGSADSEGKGIGLENIEKRYQLLSNQAPKVSKTALEFCVELPLLKITP